MEPKIKEFISERKADWIKKKSSVNLSIEEKFKIEHDADVVFSLENWLPSAARRASQLSLVSHPSTFSHPSAKTNPIIAENKKSADGFLRSGNVAVKLDAFGNAAAMDVYKFISLELSDGQTVLQHLEENSDTIKNVLKISSMTYEDLCAGFLCIKKTNITPLTREMVKQVYFPVNDKYHLLSILSPSGLIYELRKRIQNIRFSDEVKVAREAKKKSVHNENGFNDVYRLSMIGFGGTKPQNISVLNSSNGGKAYLLPSLPPFLDKKNQRLPKYDFFKNILWPKDKDCKDDFVKLDKLFKTDHNTINISEGINWRIESVLKYIIDNMWLVRSHPPGWSASKYYSKLPRYQKIWLDDSHKEDREKQDKWIDEVISDCARWICNAYKIVAGSKATLLSDTELRHIKKIVEENKENLL